jgi:hypothetical protein
VARKYHANAQGNFLILTAPGAVAPVTPALSQTEHDGVRLMTTDQNTRIETRQAIRTRYAGPTNTRGSRIIVTDSRYFDEPRNRHVHYWDYEADANENHARAAQEFLNRFYGDKNEVPRYVIDGPGLCFDDDFYFTWRAAK